AARAARRAGRRGRRTWSRWRSPHPLGRRYAARRASIPEVDSTRPGARIVSAAYAPSVAVHAGPSVPIANAAVAYASAAPSSGPATVTESTPLGGRPV